MDRSKLPKMHPGKVVPIPKVIPQTPRKTSTSVAGAMDDDATKRIKKRKDMLKEAAGN